MGCLKRTASKHVYYLGRNRSPAQVGCMRQALGPGALGRPRGIGWRGRWEGGSGWGTHVNPWLFHFNVWQNPLKEKKKKIRRFQKTLIPSFCVWKILMISSLNSCMGSWHSEPASHVTTWVLLCLPLAVCVCVIRFGLLSTARDRVKPFRLIYWAHDSVSACPCLCWSPDSNDTDDLVCGNYFSLISKVHVKQSYD